MIGWDGCTRHKARRSRRSRTTACSSPTPRAAMQTATGSLARWPRLEPRLWTPVAEAAPLDTLRRSHHRLELLLGCGLPRSASPHRLPQLNRIALKVVQAGTAAGRVLLP